MCEQHGMDTKWIHQAHCILPTCTISFYYLLTFFFKIFVSINGWCVYMYVCAPQRSRGCQILWSLNYGCALPCEPSGRAVSDLNLGSLAPVRWLPNGYQRGRRKGGVASRRYRSKCTHFQLEGGREEMATWWDSKESELLGIHPFTLNHYSVYLSVYSHGWRTLATVHMWTGED